MSADEWKESQKLWSQHHELERLLWCLQNGEGFNLYVCQYSSVPYRIQLTTALLQRCDVVEISLLHLDAKQLIDEALRHALTRHPADLPIFIYDLERLLLTVDMEKNLRYVGQLNWRRSGFQRLQRSVVLWLPLAALELLAREAPDFYDWSSGFFHFIEPQAATRRFEPTHFSNNKTNNLSLKDKENWLAVLLESLQDEQLDTAGRASILYDIGDLHYALGNYEAAEDSFQHALPLYQTLQDEENIAVTMGRLANILYRRGELDEALRIRQQEELPVYERLGDVRSKAVTMGYIADILQARGELDEALRIFKQEILPTFQKVGDVGQCAVVQGRIADILQARGELDEALRIQREEVLPACEYLGEVKGKAVTMGKIADILQARGELDEALRIRQQEELPVYDRLGDVHSKAVTMGKIADILEARGELDEALRIRQQEELPVYDRLGDVRSKAVTMGKIANILQARGELDEALRIQKEEVLAACEHLKDTQGLLVTKTKIAMLLMQFTPPRRAEANALLCQALRAAERMRIPEAGQIEEILRRYEMKC